MFEMHQSRPRHQTRCPSPSALGQPYCGPRKSGPIHRWGRLATTHRTLPANWPFPRHRVASDRSGQSPAPPTHPNQILDRSRTASARAIPSGTRKTVRELVRYSLVESDGTASDVLLRLAGGPLTVTKYLRSLGISNLVIANSEMDMSWQRQYDDWCTPEAAVQLLVILEKGTAGSESSRDLLLQYMQETDTGKNRIRKLLPKGTTVADKTVASGTQDGRTAATNDTGLVTLPDGRYMAIAIFVIDAEASDEIRDEVIAEIARAAWDEWVAKR